LVASYSQFIEEQTDYQVFCTHFSCS